MTRQAILGRVDSVVINVATTVGVLLTGAAVVIGVNLIWTLAEIANGMIH